jgi:hypothetical protein
LRSTLRSANRTESLPGAARGWGLSLSEAFREWLAGFDEHFADNGPGIVAEERGGLLDVTPAEVGTIDRPTLLGHLIDAAHPAVLAFVDEVLTLKEEPSTA